MNKTALIILLVIVVLVVGIVAYYMLNQPSGVEVDQSQMQDDSQNQMSDSSQDNMQAVNIFDIQGMKVEVLAEGSGDVAVKEGDSVTVNYVGTLEDGTKFDASADHGGPAKFALVQGGLIQGWVLGMNGMKVGEKRRLTIPSNLGYGEQGYPPVIPQNATLIFVIELLAIN